ncbi:MAG TPA: alpha/beta-type small acid-soluble spore protein [Candidatus Excrementavichristensenella intestinipullorum]|nr:alpha/beta-type small acid-soluble spore protein [Candidatus Excrementavichristensenella intestinipullorum]
MANQNSNRINVPEARQAMNNMKYEVANELGINLKQGYNGDLASRDAGNIGGNMVKKMIEAQEKAMSGQR